MSRQGDIKDILGEIESASPYIGKRSRADEVMKHFAKISLPLSICADSRHMGRKIDTLKRYARRLGLAFPDYVPRAIRGKGEKK